ncbi:MAG: cytidylate kinase-like family protein [Eubacterium sp.]
MKHFVITIGREFGSGGLEIGKEVARQLGVKCYDNDLVNKLAEKLGISRDVLENIEESRTHLRYTVDTKYGYRNISMMDKMIQAQSEIIQEIAEKESCVIVGRCGDFVLQNRKDILTVFIYASEQYRLKRIMESREWNVEQASKMLYQTEHQRRAYYKYVTGRDQTTRIGRHLMLDSGVLGQELTTRLIVEAARERFKDA